MIAVVGSGTMGKGIAVELARYNKEVLLISVGRHLLKDKLRDEIEAVIDKYKVENKDEILSRITPTNEFRLVNDCNLIIEAVAENLEVKRETIKNITEHMQASSIIASNTSSLSIFDIFNGLVPLEKAVGVHFFNPVQIMKLVEISYLEETSEKTLGFAKELVNSVNKEYVIVKNSPGFIVNRLLIPMINEAAKIVDEGIASPEDVDKAMKLGANHPIGPLKLSDLIGNDITLSILKVLQSELHDFEIAESLTKLVDEKRLGRKTKCGFFEY